MEWSVRFIVRNGDKTFPVVVHPFNNKEECRQWWSDGGYKKHLGEGDSLASGALWIPME